MKKIAVFASGFGSNFEAIIESVNGGELNAEVALLVSDKPDCFAVERANNHQIETFTFNPKEYSSKEEYETEIAAILIEKKVDLIVLAGYMKLVGKVLLDKFAGKIINIHPALLPAFPGAHAIEDAYRYGVKVFGVTVHFVDDGVDTGKIIAQDCFKIEGHETMEEVETKIHHIEHRFYPDVIQKLLNNSFSHN